MFKLVVLCVFAAAVAEPQYNFAFENPPAVVSYPSVVPATTTITQQSSLIAHPSTTYSNAYGYTGYTHYLKKRSADPEASPEPEANPEPEAKPDPQLVSYSAPSLYYPNTLSSPVINPFYPGYSGYSGFSAYPYQARYPLISHLIKKRSAQFIAPTTYVPSSYAVPSYNPYYPTTYLGNKFYPGAVVYGQHYIKKRSASVLPYTTPYVTPYTIPTTYYGNSYYPTAATTYVGNNYYPSAAVVGLHSIKKRSAQILAAPTFYTPTTAYAGAAPVYTSTYTAASPVVSSYPFVASYPYSTFIKK